MVRRKNQGAFVAIPPDYHNCDVCNYGEETLLEEWTNGEPVDLQAKRSVVLSVSQKTEIREIIREYAESMLPDYGVLIHKTERLDSAVNEVAAVIEGKDPK